jgi:hypothetical protein
MLTRRTFVVRSIGLAASGGIVPMLLAQQASRGRPATSITVYKNPSCGCCSKWIEYLRTKGFTAEVHDEADMDAVHDRLGVPEALRSCHTAQISDYLIEGHVPAPEIRRLLTEHPKIAGLAVPGMPASTPGMAAAGSPIKGFEVLSFLMNGTSKVYARY